MKAASAAVVRERKLVDPTSPINGNAVIRPGTYACVVGRSALLFAAPYALLAVTLRSSARPHFMLWIGQVGSSYHLLEVSCAKQ